MARGFSLRYLGARLRVALDHTLHSSVSSAESLTDALTKGVQAYQRDLTGLLYITGAAMAPTLNAGAATSSSSFSPPSSSSPPSPVAPSTAAGGGVEKLLVRWLPVPSARTVFVGDVVAFTSPLAAPDPDGVAEPAVMVRRVAATAGDEMVSDDPDDVAWCIPEGHCWVLADNEALGPSEAIDSRAFGPLPFRNVLGRVLYSASSPSRHGPVENSSQAAARDGPVLAAELDVEQFANWPEAGKE